jgi:hypothetical protein
MDKSKLDYFFIYCPDNKLIYYLPISIFGDGYCLQLRIKEPKMIYKTMKMGKDYLNLRF